MNNAAVENSRRRDSPGGGRQVPFFVQDLFPRALAVATFLAGALLLISGSLPVDRIHLLWIRKTVALPIFETSHFLGSLTGLVLLLLGRYLEDRIYAAYILAVLFLSVGAGASLLKGAHIGLSVLLGIILLCLILSRGYFYRKSSLLAYPFSPGWAAAIGVVLASAFSLGMFAYRHVEYSQDLWWRFEFSNGASRFLRAWVGIAVLAGVLALQRLFRPAPPVFAVPTTEESALIRRIVGTSARAAANLAFLPDKRFLFSANRRAFIMYGIQGASWIALGDPVGPPAEWKELIWRYKELCSRYRGWTVFTEIGRDALALYLDAGMTLLKMGEEATVPLEHFDLKGGANKNFRHLLNREDVRRCRFAIAAPPHAPELIAQLQEVSGRWITVKGGKEKGFSLGSFDEKYLQNFLIGTIEDQGRLIAFTNIWTTLDREEIAPDVMRYDPRRSLPGIMDYLFIQLMFWAKAEGYQRFNLGSVLLAGFEQHALAPFWHKVGTMVFRHAEYFYGFQGLREFKAKFHPQWESKYLACPSGYTVPRVLTDYALLVAQAAGGRFKGERDAP